MKTTFLKVDVEVMKGEVEVRLPSFDERYDYLDALEIDAETEDKALEQIEKRSTKDKLKMVRKMVSLSIPHYVKVDIVNEATGEEYKSVEDLNYGGSEGHAVLMDLASKIINGGVPKTMPQPPST